MTVVGRRLLLGLVALLAGLVSAVQPLVGVTSVAAHAVVVASQPGNRERLPEAPDQVSVTFSEQVSAVDGGLTVVDGDGVRVDEGDGAVLADGATVAVGLPDGLADGTYFATYRVISADGHAVNGAVVFGVGDGGVVDASPATAGGDRGAEAAQVLARFLVYVGGLAAAGVAVFVAFVHDGGPERPRLASRVRGGCVVGAVGALAVVACQAALATGRGLGAVVDPAVLRAVLTGGLGWASVALLGGLVAVHLSVDVEQRTASQTLAFYGALATVGSFALWGHSSQAPQPVVALTADAVHAAAAAVWFGGLLCLPTVLRRRAGGPVPDDGPGSAASTAGVVGRFSTVAGVSVVALALAGLVLGWQEVGSASALVTTTYGRLLLVKVAVAAAVGGVAAYNRLRLVPDVRAAAAEPGGGAAASARLARTVRVEAVGIVVVLAVTAVLVNVTPGRVAAGPTAAGPFSRTERAEGRAEQVDLVISPNQAGRNSVHVTVLDAAGTPVPGARSAEARLTMPEAGVGPLTVPLVPAGPGHFIAEDVDELATPGNWTVEVVVRLSAFEEARATFLDEVAPTPERP